MIDLQANPDVVDAVVNAFSDEYFIEKDYLGVLSISEMGHFLNRTLWYNQAALLSSLRF